MVTLWLQGNNNLCFVNYCVFPTFAFLMVEIKLLKLDIMLLHKEQGRKQSSFSYKIHNQIYLFCLMS